MPRPRASAAVVSFRGRLDRTGFAVRFLALASALTVTWLGCFKLPYGDLFGPGAFMPIVGIAILCVMATAVFLTLLLFAMIQRLHDMALPGACLLVLVVPVACLSGLALFVWPGTPGANRFDPPQVAAGSPGVARPPAEAAAWATVAGVGVTSALGAGIAIVVGICALVGWLLTHMRIG